MKDYLSIVYDEKRTPRTSYPRCLVAHLCNRLKLEKGSQILEIGCGRGELINAFHELDMQCSAVDRELYPNIPSLYYRSVDMLKDQLPFADNMFDLVYHKSLIEHLIDPDNLLLETLRVLKPGGICVILTPNWRSQMKVFYEDHTHVRPYDVYSLHDLMKAYEFNDISSEVFYQFPMSWRSSIVKWGCRLFGGIVSVPIARQLTKITKIKFFRWSAETMVLAIGRKK
jgi:SAM-dependent methyltransferase